MPLEDADDRAAYVDPDNGGAVVLYTPKGGAALDPINGLFTDMAALIEIGNGPQHNGRVKRLLLRVDDVPAPAEDDTAQINGVVYTVKPPFTSDGTGFTWVMLESPPS